MIVTAYDYYTVQTSKTSSICAAESFALALTAALCLPLPAFGSGQSSQSLPKWVCAAEASKIRPVATRRQRAAGLATRSYEASIE
jgi:hypothetical protein